MITKGAILHCESSRIYNELHLIPSFYFDSYFPCEYSELIIRFVDRIEMGTKILKFGRANATEEIAKILLA